MDKIALQLTYSLFVCCLSLDFSIKRLVQSQYLLGPFSLVRFILPFIQETYFIPQYTDRIRFRCSLILCDVVPEKYEISNRILHPFHNIIQCIHYSPCLLNEFNRIPMSLMISFESGLLIPFTFQFFRFFTQRIQRTLINSFK